MSPTTPEETAVIMPGQALENPVTGERFMFTETAASSSGELLAFDFALRPGGAVPIPHVHPAQSERFEILEGRMRFRTGLRTFVAEAGEVVEIAPGVAHSFANAGDAEARLRVEVRPALDMEEMLAEVVSMAQAGRMTRRGLPRNPFAFARLARKYDHVAHAPLMTAKAQRLLLAPFALSARRVARRHGRRARRDGRARRCRVSTRAEELTLVLGATGKTGRRVLEQLRSRGHSVRAGSRSGATPFDWDDRETWSPALQGATAAYISYFPDLAAPGAADAVGAFAERAVASGVLRLVLLSGRGEEEAQLAEAVVREASPACTVVRCSWFSQNFSEGYMLEPVLAGEVALPVGDVPEPFVDVDDIADVAVAALTEEGHAGKLYELTGPRLLTFAEATAEIAAATGRSVEFVPVSMEAYAAAAAEQGVPDDLIHLLRYLFTEVLDGRNAQTADGVRQALGREPRDFADFARDAAAAGIWSP